MLRNHRSWKTIEKVNTIIRELITHHEQYFDYLPHQKTFTQQLQRLFGITNQQIHINTKSWTFFLYFKLLVILGSLGLYGHDID